MARGSVFVFYVRFGLLKHIAISGNCLHAIAAVRIHGVALCLGGRAFVFSTCVSSVPSFSMFSSHTAAQCMICSSKITALNILVAHRSAGWISNLGCCRGYSSSSSFRSRPPHLIHSLHMDPLLDAFVSEITVSRGWTKRESSAVRDKISKAGIKSYDDFRGRLLADELNSLLKEFGLTPFQSATLRLMTDIVKDVEVFEEAMEDARRELAYLYTRIGNGVAEKKPSTDDPILRPDWTKLMVRKFQKARIISCAAYLRAYSDGPDAVNSLLEPPSLFSKTLEILQQAILRRTAASVPESLRTVCRVDGRSGAPTLSVGCPGAVILNPGHLPGTLELHDFPRSAHVFMFDGLVHPCAIQSIGVEFAQMRPGTLPNHRLQMSWARPSSFFRERSEVFLYPNAVPISSSSLNAQAAVRGVIYEVHPLCLSILDNHYRLSQGIGRRCVVSVQTPSSEVVRCIMYVSNDGVSASGVRPNSPPRRHPASSLLPNSAVSIDPVSVFWMAMARSVSPDVSVDQDLSKTLDILSTYTRSVFITDLDFSQDKDSLQHARRVVAASCIRERLSGHIIEFDAFSFRQQVQNLRGFDANLLDRSVILECSALGYGHRSELCLAFKHNLARSPKLEAGSIVVGSHAARDVEYVVGNLPIVLSIPHGGSASPYEMADRCGDGVVTATDSFTIELGCDLHSELSSLDAASGNRNSPHMVICNLKRCKVDVNRDQSSGSAGNIRGDLAWTDYHKLLEEACESCVEEHGFALLVDMHGMHPRYPVTQLGYLVDLEDLDNAEILCRDSSVASLAIRKPGKCQVVDMVTGDSSLGALMVKYGIDAGPSPKFPSPALSSDQRYFKGHFNIRRHTGKNVIGVQIETTSGPRRTGPKRKAYAASLAGALRDFLYAHYSYRV
ncbi:mitochondrial N-formylglutamate amidohydrolase [Andalucia godoyi]|uniref:Mitochondrial N-formylglutamate amidohydrolase n=1 Tax=Andalucia godoyi TaxID=505711 RepID=A0A8K0F4D0_ANDGO|nr:mitochondrial N-formylglutamate amidohydrolase [Andalucia godoyi]|eukprot:ANDGO_07578.mRNA.1 mitochondrial N-formylglutamate amidohydrolase